MSDVDLQFGANTGEVDKGVAAVNTKLNEISNNVSSLQSGFASFGEEVRSSFSAVEEGIGSLNSAFKDLNDSIEKGGSTLSTGWMKVLFGLGAGGAAAGILTVFHNIEEGFIKIEQGATEANVSMERFQELAYALNQSGASMEKMQSGLTEAAKKLNELTHDSGELGKFLDENNVKWKDASGQIVDMNQYLEISARLVANAATEGDRFKAGELLGWSKEWVRVLQGGPATFRQLAEEAHTSGAVFNDELIKRAVDFETEWNKASLQWSTYFKELLVDMTPYVMAFINALGKAVDYIKNIAVALGSAIAQDFKDAFNPSSSFKPLADSAQVLAGTMPGLYQTMSMFMEASEKSKVNWDGIVTDAKAMSADMARLASSSFATGGSATKFPGKDDDKDNTSAELAKINTQIDAWRSYFDKLKVYEKNAVDTFKETESQKVANLLAALSQRETAVKALYEQEIKVAGDNATKVEEIRRKMNKAIEEMDKERMQLEAENLKRSAQEWQSTLSTITSAFNSQLRGLLAGTTTWAQAMRNIAADLVIKIIEEFEKLAIIKPLTSILANSLSAPTELFSGLIKVVSGMLGPLTAGFTSFFAPEMGPAAPAAGAAAAAAEVAAATALVGSFETGTDFVPRTGLALVHQGEAIIPAWQNAMGSGNPSTTAQFSFNVQALDASGVQAFFTRYGPQIAKMLSAHMQQNPSFQT